jgi:hypothetical protein
MKFFVLQSIIWGREFGAEKHDWRTGSDACSSIDWGNPEADRNPFRWSA